MPNYLGHADNYIPANPLVTPAHIVPEWYFLPFYAILRAIPDKLGGVIAMFGSIAVLVFLPWLDTSKVRSARLPAALQAVLLDLRRRLHRCSASSARSRRRARYVARRADLHRPTTSPTSSIILPLLGLFENAAAAAGLDRRIGARRAERAARACRPAPRPHRRPRAEASDARGRCTMTQVRASPRRPSPRARPSRARAARGRRRRRMPPPQTWSFAGPVRQVRPGAAAARLQGLPRGLRGLPRLELRVPSATSPQPGGPEFSEAQVTALAAEYKIQDGPNDAGRDVRAPGPPGRPLPVRRSRTSRRPRPPTAARRRRTCR